MKPMTSLPEKGNPFYNTTGAGGYSWCIQGKPVVSGLNVYCNCVGHSCGRFNEVYSECTGYKCMRYPQLNCNAENFYGRAKSLGLTVKSEPTLGGIMIWEGKGDLAGHVANVEKVYNSTSVMTSESGYNHFDFQNFNRSAGSNGNWGLDTRYYKYLGCIVNPGNPSPEPEPTPPTPSDYPFNGIVKKGSALYAANGTKYKYGAQADRAVEVQGELGGRYKVYGSTFNPHIVYVDKGNVIRQGQVYPFNGIVAKGSPLYNVNGYKYPSNASADRRVTVQGEVNGRYQVWGQTFTPHVVYVDKGNVRRA